MQVILQAVFGLNDSPQLSQIRSMLADWIELTASPLRASLLFFPWLQKDLGPWSPWGKYQRQQQKLDELLDTEITTRRSQFALWRWQSSLFGNGTRRFRDAFGLGNSII
ncbi:MAG: cytochrome P450 [Trichodesmium sp. MAG_R03]|nr:cytochrome P450 [Trichodesmium sp. MAG_R03]